MQIGSPDWLLHHQDLRNLTALTQRQASSQKEEWAKTMLAHTADAMNVLVQNLVCHEVSRFLCTKAIQGWHRTYLVIRSSCVSLQVWASQVLPTAETQVKAEETLSYIVLYCLQSHEQMMAALLETLCYYEVTKRASFVILV